MISALYEEARRAYGEQRFAAALELLRLARGTSLPSPELLVQEAQCLYYLCRAREAIVILEKLMEEYPENRVGYAAILALYVRAIGEFDRSEQLLREVPDSIAGKAFLGGWHLLRHGKFLEGMRMREREPGIYRVDALFPEAFPEGKKYRPGTPLWGTTILLALEGGNGDEIAYVRYAQLLANKGARVIVGATNDLVSAIVRIPGVYMALPIEAVRADIYDWYIPAMSFISLFEIEDPSEGILFPYVRPHEEGVRLFGPEIENAARGRKRIGIQWKGNPQFDYSEFKTFPASLLAPFAQIGQLFSLQVHDRLGGNLLPVEARAYNLQEGAPTWEKTIVSISQMEYIIAGDTTIAHMAGALGVPTALLLPHAPHPYWADLRERASWYPSVRVFRQPHYNDWEGAARNAFAWIESGDR